MPETIFVRFDPTTLPEWAQKHRAVVERARVDLAFRCNVFRVIEGWDKLRLIRETERLNEERANA